MILCLLILIGLAMLLKLLLFFEDEGLECAFLQHLLKHFEMLGMLFWLNHVEADAEGRGWLHYLALACLPGLRLIN
jgi:hypothetical protein